MLWYDCGNGWTPTYWARKNLNLDAILCCPGPSLESVNAEKLNGYGRKVFAINTAYPTIKPDIWIGMDEMHCYDANILNEPFAKVFRGTYCEMKFSGNFVKHCPETYFADVAEVPAGKTMLELRDHNVKFAWHNHTLGVALHLMIWMGAKNIYLLGCDMGGDKDYCHTLQLTPDQRTRNQKLYFQQTMFIQKLSEAAKNYGIYIKSSTANSPLNKFLQYVPIDQVLIKTKTSSSFRYVTDKP